MLEFVVKIVLIQDTQGDAQAHALQHGQGRANRSTIGGDLSPTVVHGVSSDNQLKLPPNIFYPPGWISIHHTNVYKFYTAEGRTEKTGCAAEFPELCPERLSRDLGHTCRDIQRLTPTFSPPAELRPTEKSMWVLDLAIT